MFYCQKDGRHISGDQGFTLNGIQYPPNWLSLSSDSEIEAIGLVRVVEVGERKDNLYFDNTETLEGALLTITAIPKDVVAIKAIKWEAIKAERNRRKAGGVKVGAKWFHSDDGSRIQQMGLVMMGANIPTNLQWKTMDGSFITMTQTLASQVFQAVAASDQAIFTVAEQHKAAMEASADPASYDYSTGWPKIYGE